MAFPVFRLPTDLSSNSGPPRYVKPLTPSDVAAANVQAAAARAQEPERDAPSKVILYGKKDQKRRTHRTHECDYRGQIYRAVDFLFGMGNLSEIFFRNSLISNRVGQDCIFGVIGVGSEVFFEQVIVKKIKCPKKKIKQRQSTENTRLLDSGMMALCERVRTFGDSNFSQLVKGASLGGKIGLYLEEVFCDSDCLDKLTKWTKRGLAFSVGAIAGATVTYCISRHPGLTRNTDLELAGSNTSRKDDVPSVSLLVGTTASSQKEREDVAPSAANSGVLVHDPHNLGTPTAGLQETPRNTVVQARAPDSSTLVVPTSATGAQSADQAVQPAPVTNNNLGIEHYQNGQDQLSRNVV